MQPVETSHHLQVGRRHRTWQVVDTSTADMQNLRLLERLFPDALFVHLIRDGRDAALSFLAMPRGIVTETWMHPRTPAEFACQWRTEVAAARRLGGRVGRRYLELRYEDLVADADAALRSVCAFFKLLGTYPIDVH